MNIQTIIALTLATSAITLSPVLASAEPIGLDVLIQCPSPNNSSSKLANHGDYTAGYGVESIAGQTSTAIYFQSQASTHHIPANLTNYTNSGVQYNSTTGEVECAYQSDENDPVFDVVYTLTNGKGGFASSGASDQIHITIPFGRKK